MPGKRTRRIRVDEVERLLAVRGMSRQQLAEEAKIHPKTLKRLMEGGKGFPANISRIATALGLKTSETILEGYQPPDIAQKKQILFKTTISIEGEVDRPEQIAQMITLTPEIVAALAKMGIKIRGADNVMKVDEWVGDGLKRTLVLIYGMLESGGPYWTFAAVRPNLYPAFVTAQKAGVLDLYHFESYGEIIVSGEGELPPDDVTLKVAELFQTDPDALQQAVIEDGAKANPPRQPNS